jgi:galactose-1-phosphate uridylyltransferase
MAGNDEVIMEEILLAIQSIKPENIGDYNEIDLSPLEIGAEDIRTSIAPTAYAELAKAVINLTDKQTVFLVFMSFRKTYKYVFHLHNKYKMKFHPTLSDKKNEKLGSTLEMAARKFQI